MEDFLEAAGIVLLVLAILVLTSIGILHLVSDYREFNDVAVACRDYGYVQNDKYRIVCSLEK